MTLNHENIRNRAGVIRKYWSVISLLIVCMITLIYYLLIRVGTGNINGRLGNSFYWFYVDAEPRFVTDIVFGIIPIVTLLVLMLGSILNVRRYWKSWEGCTGLFIVAMAFCFLSYVSFVFWYPSNNIQLDELSQNSRLYRLASWFGSSDGSHYILFECDSAGIICSEICSSSFDYFKLNQNKPHISIDSSNLVSMMQGSKTLCSAEANS